MILYLSASYNRVEEMRQLRRVLDAVPHVYVQSSWLDMDKNTPYPICAHTDKVDIRTCDVLVAFTEKAGIWTSGGRHVEFGIAWEAGKKLWIVGPEENVFHSIAHERFENADALQKHLWRVAK